MPTDFSRVTFDVGSMRITTKSFTRKLSVLVEYGAQKRESLTKLQIVGAELQIDNNYLQGLRRWWNGQSREELYRYLRDELNEYITFLDMVNIAVNHHRFSPEFQSIRDQNVAFVQSILPGLKQLPHLYPCYEMFNSAIRWAIDRFEMFLQRHCCRVAECVIKDTLLQQTK